MNLAVRVTKYLGMEHKTWVVILISVKHWACLTCIIPEINDQVLTDLIGILSDDDK